MENIAIYGGSFNPPTTAHAKVLKDILNKTEINKIIFTPDGERDDKDHGIEQVDRKNMIQIFYEVLKNSGINIEIDTYFLDAKNGGDTTSVQVRDYFMKKLGIDPWFVFGTDVIPQMPNWKGNKDKIIEEKLKKIFIPRPGHFHNPKDYGIDKYILLNIPDLVEISSTMARTMVANKQKVSDILFDEVVEYIDKNNLYKNV